MDHLKVCQNLVPLVNIKIAGKWMFIPLKMVLIGIDPYRFRSIANSKHLDEVTDIHVETRQLFRADWTESIAFFNTGSIKLLAWRLRILHFIRTKRCNI